jgi:hypothetical protein
LIIRFNWDSSEYPDFSMTDLVMALDEDINFTLPIGEPANGVLKAIHPLEDGWVRLTIDIDDGWQPYLVAPYN